jgi:hypothetical protein
MVNAAAIAVDCTSAALIVGTGSAPHALIKMPMIIRIRVTLNNFMG